MLCTAWHAAGSLDRQITLRGKQSSYARVCSCSKIEPEIRSNKHKLIVGRNYVAILQATGQVGPVSQRNKVNC